MPAVVPLLVKATIERGVIVLSVAYDPQLFMQNRAGALIGDELIRHYQVKRGSPEVKGASCVVALGSPVAGSPIVRALYDLWQEVALGEGGQLVCVGYPREYMSALTTLGMLELPGFRLADSKEEALAQARTTK